MKTEKVVHQNGNYLKYSYLYNHLSWWNYHAYAVCLDGINCIQNRRSEHGITAAIYS